jgi:hypothetical protein
MPPFRFAQLIALAAGVVLLITLGVRGLPPPVWVVTARLGGTGALAAERLLLATLGLPWTPLTLIAPWLALAALAAARLLYPRWRNRDPGQSLTHTTQSAIRTLKSAIRRPHSAIPFAWVLDVAAAALLIGWTAALWWQATNTPLDGWDAWAMWFLKGRALFQEGTVPAALLTDPHYAGYAHLDYPLLVPLTIAGTYAWTGDHDPLMKGWWALLAGAAGAGLYWGGAGLISRAARWGGLLLLLGVPDLVKHAAGYYAGYADLPLAVLALFGAIFLYRWLRQPAAGTFAAAALFFSLAGFAKNEGLVTAGVGLALLFGLGLLRRQITWAGAGAAVALAAIILLPWQWDKATLHITGDIQPTWALVQAQWAARIPPIVNGLTLMAASPYHQNLVWPVLPLLGTGALVFTTRRWLRTLPLLALIAAQIAATMLAYIVTPHDLAWHLHTSVDRVVFQPSLIALFLGTLYLGLLLDRDETRDA